LLEEELTRQRCSYRATQLPPDKNSNRWDNLVQTGSELPQVPIATCTVNRRKQILLRNPSSDETTSELPLVTDGP
jgi:hypothetical protein